MWKRRLKQSKVLIFNPFNLDLPETEPSPTNLTIINHVRLLSTFLRSLQSSNCRCSILCLTITNAVLPLDMELICLLRSVSHSILNSPIYVWNLDNTAKDGNNNDDGAELSFLTDTVSSTTMGTVHLTRPKCLRLTSPPVPTDRNEGDIDHELTGSRKCGREEWDLLWNGYLTVFKNADTAKLDELSDVPESVNFYSTQILCRQLPDSQEESRQSISKLTKMMQNVRYFQVKECGDNDIMNPSLPIANLFKLESSYWKMDGKHFMLYPQFSTFVDTNSTFMFKFHDSDLQLVWLTDIMQNIHDNLISSKENGEMQKAKDLLREELLLIMGEEDVEKVLDINHFGEGQKLVEKEKSVNVESEHIPLPSNQLKANLISIIPEQVSGSKKKSSKQRQLKTVEASVPEKPAIRKPRVSNLARVKQQQQLKQQEHKQKKPKTLK